MDDNDDIEFDADLPISHTPRANHPASSTNYGSSSHSNIQNQNQNHSPEDNLSPLEQEVLDEYARLVGNLDDLANVLNELASRPSAEILDALRGLERKTSTVFTLLKASVYSIVLQQEIKEG